MTLEEYLDRMRNQPEWKPGWEAIAARLANLYGRNGFTYINAADILNDDKGVEGFAVAASPKGYMHITTVGLTNISASEDAFGNAASGWGYEITVKWPGTGIDQCRDAFKLLNRLASYAQVKRVRFRKYQLLSLSRLSPVPGVRTESLFGVLFLEDTELHAMDTMNGRVEFLQIVNVTAAEMKRLRSFRHLTRQLAFNLSKENPDLQMEPTRSKNYLSE